MTADEIHRSRPCSDVGMGHPVNAPMPGIVVCQRDRLAQWLRQRKMVRYDSHQVARDPGARWWIMHGSDGWVRAVRKVTPTYDPRDWMARKLGRAGIRITEVYVMRFTKLPVDS